MIQHQIEDVAHGAVRGPQTHTFSYQYLSLQTLTQAALLSESRLDSSDLKDLLPALKPL